MSAELLLLFEVLLLDEFIPGVFESEGLWGLFIPIFPRGTWPVFVEDDRETPTCSVLEPFVTPWEAKAFLLLVEMLNCSVI